MRAASSPLHAAVAAVLVVGAACDPRPAPPSGADASPAPLGRACRRVAEARRALRGAGEAAELLRRGDALAAAERAVARAARAVGDPNSARDDYADALAVAAESLERSLRAASEGDRLDRAAARANALVTAAAARDEARVPSSCPPQGVARLELDAFIARAELACYRFADEVARVERIEVDDEGRAASAASIAAIHAALRSFVEALEDARGDGLENESARELVAVHRRRLAAFDRLGVALLRGQRRDYHAAARAYRALSIAADAVARRLGAEECIRF